MRKNIFDFELDFLGVALVAQEKRFLAIAHDDESLGRNAELVHGPFAENLAVVGVNTYGHIPCRWQSLAANAARNSLRRRCFRS